MTRKTNSTALKIEDNEELAHIASSNLDRLLAINELSRILKGNPKSFLAYKLRGIVELELGLKSEALIDFERALALNAEDDSILNLLGMVKLALGEKEAAVLYFSKAIEQNQNNQQAFFNRGRAKYALGQHVEAIIDFKQALTVDANHEQLNSEQLPKNSSILYQLKLIKKALGDLHQKIDPESIIKKPLMVK